MAWARLCCGRRTQGRPGVAREAWTALDQESKQRRRGSAWLLWRVRLKPLLGSARGRDDQHRRRHTRPAHRAWDHRALVHIPGVRLLRHPRRRAAAPQTKRMTPRHRACRGSAKTRHRVEAACLYEQQFARSCGQAEPDRAGKRLRITQSEGWVSYGRNDGDPPLLEELFSCSLVDDLDVEDNVVADERRVELREKQLIAAFL
jgi:hypothetical protein